MSDTYQLSNGGKIDFEPNVPDEERQRVLADFKAQGIDAVEPSSGLGAARRSVERGASVGLMDEVGAYGQAVGQQLRNLTHGEDVGFWEAKDRALGENRAEMRADREKLGGGALALEAVGGLASVPIGRGAQAFGITQQAAKQAPAVSQFGTQPITALQAATGKLGDIARRAAGLGPAATNPTMVGNVGKAAQAGAVNGLAVGFAEGEGGVMDRLDNAAKGAIFGAGGGAAIGSLMDGLPRLGRMLFGPTKEGLARHSSAALITAFEKDGFTRAQALDAISDWQQRGSPDEVLADIGGPAVKRLARAARSASPKAASQADQQLVGRHLEQNERIQDATRKATGARGDRVYETVEELAATRSREARPLYEEAFNEQAPWSDWLKDAADNPTIQKAIARGRVLQRDEALAMRMPQQRAQAITGFADDGSPIVGQVPTVRDWDAAKRGLDDIIQESGRDPKTWRLNQRGVTYNNLKQELLGELDSRVPVYAEARAAWADPSEAIDMAAEGRRIFSQDPEQIQRTLAGLRNEQNAEYFRIGVARALEDKLDAARAGRDATLMFTPKMWAQIRAALGDEATSALQGSIARETNMANTLNVVSRGSQTQDKMADALMLAQPESMAGMTNFLQGDVRGGALRQATEFANRRAMGVTEKVGERLGDQMFTTAAEAGNVAGGVRDSARQQIIEALRRAQSERQAGTAAGRIAGLLSGP